MCSEGFKVWKTVYYLVLAYWTAFRFVAWYVPQYVHVNLGIYSQIIIFDNPTFYESNMSVAILQYRIGV